MQQNDAAVKAKKAIRRKSAQKAGKTVNKKDIRKTKKTHSGKIATRMLAFILPVLVVGMLVLTVVSAYSSKGIIDEEIGKEMNLNLENEQKMIQSQIDSASGLSRHMAGIVGLTYQTEDLLSYIKFLDTMIYEEDFISGSGIWFEPNAYDEKQRYIGPYVYKSGENPILTYEYSNADYDYFSQDFYTRVKEADGATIYTEAHYEEILKETVVTCASPMYNAEKKFIGCVTVNITLDTLQDLMADIKVGDSGKAFLLAQDGTFLYTDEEEKVLQQKITEDENTSYASAGQEMLENESGNTHFSKGATTYSLYYKTIPGLDWKLGMVVKNSELNEPIVQLCFILGAIAVVILVILIIVIMMQIAAVSRQIKTVKNFAVQLAKGDFTVSAIKNKRADELGEMGSSLNEMYGNNRDMITKISDHAQILNGSSSELKSSARKLQSEFHKIEELMNTVNQDMTTSGAATEEVNAAVQEVTSSVNVLAEQTGKSLQLSNEIKGRAIQIETTSTKSYQYATELTDKHKNGLKESISNADVVKTIGQMAEVIAEIASQINLLSLNASIEAARAGEQGRGFAVVASEIGKLANETSTAVNSIKNTVGAVESAFDNLVQQSQAMLSFVSDTVAPDYDTFVNVAKQYGEDAHTIESVSNDIADMASKIETIIQEVGADVQSVASSAQNTVENSTVIMDSVDCVSSVMNEVSDMASQQEQIAGDLQTVVGKFILEKAKEQEQIKE